MKTQSTPESIARGEYLAHHVAGCFSCHSERNWKTFAAPLIPESHGQGGERFEGDDMPGVFIAPNITPYNLKNWSDSEILRAITSGVDKDSQPLFPLMPYQDYGHAAQEDMEAIVHYLRTIPEIKKDNDDSSFKFPMNIIVRFIPKAPHFQQRPMETISIEHGKYLVNLAGCGHCHTQRDSHGEPIAGKEFAGGFRFPLPSGGVAVSANITPDVNTGIGQWTRESFIQRFKSIQYSPVENGAFNTVMDWKSYAGMSDTDLGAIFDYLKSLKPISHEVIHFITPEDSATKLSP